MYPFGSGMPHGGSPYNQSQKNSSVPFGAGRWADPSQNPPPSSYLPNQHNTPSAPFGAGRWIDPSQSVYPSSQPTQSPYPSYQPPYPTSNPYPPQSQYSSHQPSQAPYPTGNTYQAPTNSPYPAYPPAQPQPQPQHHHHHQHQQQQQQTCPYPPSSTTSSYPSHNSSSSYNASQRGFTYLPQNSSPSRSGHQQSSPYPSQTSSPYPPSGSPYRTATYNVAQTSSYPQGVRATVPRKGTPTVFPASDFDPVKDAHALRKAMRGFGTDEDALINIICRRSNAQRQEIARQYKTHFGKDLIENIISETSGNFQKVLVGLLLPIVDFYVKELNDAMAGLGTDEDVLIEVMCTLSNYEIHTIKDAYRRTYGRDLESELISETSGNFKRLMVALCTGARDESGVVDQAAALNDARELLNAGELRFGTDESTFNAVLCQRNFHQLKLVFQEYQNLTGHSLEKAIKREFSGDIEEGLLAIYKCVMDKAEFFATRLHKSMAGIGTNDQQLIRIIITRSEIDMEDIKTAFARLYGKGLRSWIKGKPTVLPAPDFQAMQDATELRKAMRGFGTDEDALINIICRRSNAQRQEIVNVFKTHYGKNLIEEIISETSGNFRKVLIGLLMPTVDFYTKELANAMSGQGTDEDVLIEIMCTLSNDDIKTIKNAYKISYGTDLEADLVGETSGNFKRLMVSLCSAGRDESGVTDQSAAAADAKELLDAGELCFGTDESTFNMVLCQRNYQQLKLVFQEYESLAGHTLEEAIKSEFSGDIKEGLLAIYKCVMNKAGFFAEKLHKSMAGLGTDDEQLIRIIICRCEIDMQDIKEAFEKRYGESLRNWIKDDTSGDYKHALYALIGEECSAQ